MVEYQSWNLSLICLMVLGMSNMLLTFFLIQTETCREPIGLRILRNVQSAKKEESQDILGDPCSMPLADEGSSSSYNLDSQKRSTGQLLEDSAGSLNLDVRLGRWDSRKLFKSFDAILVGSRYPELSEKSRVCLATQSSLERLHYIVQVVYQWQGPISVGLYVAGDEEFDIVQKYLEFMQRCYAPVRERVAFSLLFPKDRTPKQQPRYYPVPGFLDCENPESTLDQLAEAISMEQTSWRVKNAYPQNHMRNLARKNCQTDYVFLTDIDIVPSTSLSQHLEEFLKDDDCDKCAYVVPTFELDMRMQFPQNKSELVRLTKKGLARPFHRRVFAPSQLATNYSHWMLDAQSSNGNKDNEINVEKEKLPIPAKTKVSHEVTNFKFLYEPFYVSKDVVPPHDERFMGFGYTRNTQVYEMYVAGYIFKVLTPTFTVHWGLQTVKSRPAWREKQNSINHRHVKVFKNEVLARYRRDPLKITQL